METWTIVRYMHAQGKSIRAIARELFVSHNTVRRALCCDQPPRYSRRPRHNARLAPYAEDIKQILAEKKFIGTRSPVSPIPASLFSASYQIGNPVVPYWSASSRTASLKLRSLSRR